MTIDKVVMGFAGAMVLLSLILGHYVGPNWYWLATFVGVNLFQTAFTGFCPLVVILRKMGVKAGAAF